MGSLYATIYSYIHIYTHTHVMYIHRYMLNAPYTNPQGKLLNKPCYAHIDDTHTLMAGERQGRETEPGHTSWHHGT